MEDNVVMPSKGKIGRGIGHSDKPLCDVCLHPLLRECVNLLFGVSSVTEERSAPIEKPVGSVVVRYHYRCYPSKLAEWLNKGYGHRFTMADIAAAP